VDLISVGNYALPCDVPSSFPVERYDRLARLLGTAPHLRGWSGAAEALNGVAHRHRAAVAAHERFAAVFKGAFGGDDWFAEEEAFFGVFVYGVSAIECAAYAAYHLGAMVTDAHLPTGSAAAKFPISTDRDLRAISLKGTRDAFAKHATGRPIHLALRDCVDDSKCQKLYEYRDVLAHRLIPSRSSHFIGPPGGVGTVHIAPENAVSVTISGAPKSAGPPQRDTALDAAFTRSHVDTVTRWLTAIVDAVATLADQKLPAALARLRP
jgi:hypothetical protein